MQQQQQQQQQQPQQQRYPPGSYYGGQPMYPGQASTYGAGSTAEDPFAEIYSEEMARNGMPINQQPMYYPGMQMGMAPPMAPMPYGMPMMMPGPWGYMGYAPSMGTPSMYSGASGMMYPNYPMMPYGGAPPAMNPMSMSMAKQRSDQVWNEAVNKYEKTAHSVRSQTVPPVLITGSEGAWQRDADNLTAAAAAAAAAAASAAPQPPSEVTPRMRRRVPSSRGSEFAAPSTVSAGEADGKFIHGLGPLARAEREISQVKTSKARSSQFRETRSQARTSAVRTSSANAAMTPREPFPVPATASTSSTSAASESVAFPARARSKSGVLNA